jgi:hypothetical protein
LYGTDGYGSAGFFRLNGTENPWLPDTVRQSMPIQGMSMN